MSKAKIALGQCDLIRALCELSSMFSDTAFKVLMALTTRMDYKLDNSLSVMSLTEIADMTAKSDPQIMNAIRELEARGLLVKISGKHHKEDARALRSILYHKEQQKTRSFNEVNAYDLAGLIEFVQLYLELVKKDGRKKALSKMREMRNQSLTLEKKDQRKPSYIELSIGLRGADATIEESDATIEESDATIEESDATIEESDATIEESDATNNRKTSSIADHPFNHTHTPPGELGEERGNIDEERKDIDKERGNMPSKPARSHKTEELLADEEFQEYIRQRIQEDPRVESQTAVYESIKKKPDLLSAYYRDYQRHKKAKERQNMKILLISKPAFENVNYMRTLFGEDYQALIKKLRKAHRIAETTVYICILAKKETAERLMKEARMHGLTLQVDDFTDAYDRFFA